MRIRGCRFPPWEYGDRQAKQVKLKSGGTLEADLVVAKCRRALPD